MNYVIGVDGGGTKTHLKAISMDKFLLGEAFGGPSNLSAFSRTEVEKNLEVLFDDFFKTANLLKENCAGVCLGTAGAGSALARKQLEDMLQAFFPSALHWVTNDALPALYGGTLTGCGIILIAGTGSICLARNKKGEICRTGGWGHIIGDEGSGYAIGTAILRAVMKAYDGRNPETILTDLLLEHLKLHNLEEIIDYVYHSGKSKSDFAALAQICDIAYNIGDQTAMRIYAEAAGELCDLIIAGSKAAKFDNAQHTCCVLSGGAIVKSDGLREKLGLILTKEAPEIVLSQCKEDAAYGSALIALEQLRQKEQVDIILPVFRA